MCSRLRLGLCLQGVAATAQLGEQVLSLAQPRLDVAADGRARLGPALPARALADGLLGLLLVIRDAQADGSWRRLHERRRLRGYDEQEALLRSAGFQVLNAFGDYAQDSQLPAPDGSALLLCERV